MSVASGVWRRPGPGSHGSVTAVQGPLPTARVVVDGLGRSRRRTHRTPPLIVVGAVSLTASTLVSVHVVRDLMLAVPLLIVPLAFAHWREHRRDGVLRIPVVLLLLLIWIAASYAWSSDPAKSSHLIPEYLAVAVAGIAMGVVLRPPDVHRMAALASKIIVAINAADLVLRHHSATAPGAGNPPGWHALFGQKNVLGFAMAIALTTLAFERRSGRARYAWMLLAGVMVVGSRSGAGLSVSLAVASLALWLWVMRKSLHRSSRVALKALSVALALGAGLLVAFDLRAATGLLGKSATLTGRTRIWAVVVPAIGKDWLHGYGYGGVWAGGPESQRLWAQLGFHAFEAHDQYLDTLLQLGVCGAVLFLVVLVSAWRGVLRGVVRASAEQRWMLCILFAYCLEGVVESDVFGFGFIMVAPVLVAASLLVADPTPLPQWHRPAVPEGG